MRPSTPAALHLLAAAQPRGDERGLRSGNRRGGGGLQDDGPQGFAADDLPRRPTRPKVEKVEGLPRHLISQRAELSLHVLYGTQIGRRARGTRPDLLAEDREGTEWVLRGRRRPRGGGERRRGEKQRQQHKPGQAGRVGPVLRGGHFVAARTSRRPRRRFTALSTARTTAPVSFRVKGTVPMRNSSPVAVPSTRATLTAAPSGKEV